MDHQIGVFEQPAVQNDFYMPLNGNLVLKNGYPLYPTECIVTEEFNSEFSCTLKHPIDPYGAWKHLKCYNILRVPYQVRDEQEKSQLFIILSREINKNEHGEIVITCVAYHIWYYLNFLVGNIAWTDSSAKNAAQVLSATMNSAYTTNLREYGFENAGKILYTFRYHADDTENFPLESVDFKNKLGDASVCDIIINGLISVTGYELYRNNFYFSVRKRREKAVGSAENPAFRIAYSENIKAITVSENYESSKEKMRFSIGSSEEQTNILSIKDTFSPFVMPYIGTYSTDSLESAIAEFKNINHPVVSYQIYFLDLKNSVFYKDAVIGDHFDVGDIGIVYDATIGVSTTQMITRKEYDAIKDEILSLTLGNVSESVYGMRTPSYAAGGTIASTQTTYDWDIFIRIAPAANVQYIHFRLKDLNAEAPIPYKLVWWDGETIIYDGTPTETGNTITYKKYIPIGTEEIWIGIKVDADLYRPKFQIIGTGNNVTKVTGHYSIKLSSNIKSIDDMYTYDDPHELKIISMTNTITSIKSSVFAWQPLSTIYYDGTISEFNLLAHPGMGENDFYSWFTGTFNGQTAVPYGTIDIICNDGTITMNKKNPEPEDAE